MPAYICSRCNFMTEFRSNFKRHLFRKNMCEPIYTDDSITDIASRYGIAISPTDLQKGTRKVIRGVTRGVIRKVIRGVTREVIRAPDSMDTHSMKEIKKQEGTNNKKVYACRYCNEKFKYKSGKYRHEKSRCKGVYNDYTESNKITNELKQELKTQASEMLNTIFKTKLIPVQTNIQNNTMNNTLNNNTQINNNNQHVKINNYGEEDFSYITKEKYKKLICDPRNSVPELIDDIHFHPLHPENGNVRIPNKKLPLIEIYKDNKWVTKNQYKTLCSMYMTRAKHIDSVYKNLEDELTDKEKENYLNYKNNVETSLFTVKNILTDIQANIISGTRNNKNIEELQRAEILRLAKEQNKEPIEVILELIPEEFLYQGS